MLKSVIGNKRIYLGSAISLFIFIAIAHYAALAGQKNQQLAFSKDILRKLDEVSLQLTSSLRNINHAALTECDKPTIDKIRIIAARYPYVDDIGIAHDEKLTCTASWGLLEKKVQLPQSDFITSSGFEIYKKPRNLFPSPILRNMTRLGNVVVFTSRLIADQIYIKPKGFIYELVTKNGENKFFSLTDTPPKDNFFRHFQPGYVV